MWASMVEGLSGLHEALGSTLSPTKINEEMKELVGQPKQLTSQLGLEVARRKGTP